MHMHTVFHIPNQLLGILVTFYLAPAVGCTHQSNRNSDGFIKTLYLVANKQT